MDETDEDQLEDIVQSRRRIMSQSSPRQRSLWQSTLDCRGRIPHRVLPQYQSEVNKYERLLVFADGLMPDAELEIAIDHVRASLELVSLVTGPDSGASDTLFHDLHVFYKTVVTRPQWYIHGDLFEFSDLHLEGVLYRNLFGTRNFDSGPLVKHLQKHSRPTCHNFVQKIAVVVRGLYGSNNGITNAFHLLQHILTSLRGLDPGTRAGINHLMQATLERNVSVQGPGLYWSSIPQIEASKFMDCPAACRHLRANVGGFKGREAGTIELLPVLENEARKRIRPNVYLACSSRLPVELVETVFEHVLRKEGIPLRLNLLVSKSGYNLEC